MKALLSRMTGMLVAQGCQYTGTDTLVGYVCPSYICPYPGHIQIQYPCYFSGTFQYCRCYCCTFG